MNSYAYRARNVGKHIMIYPKFLLLFITFIIAYFIFTGRSYGPLNSFILSLGLFGAFMAGVMFSYGFTAAPSTALFLIIAKEHNLWLAGFIGGIGALLGDLVIFAFIRSSFSDEIERLSKEKIIKKFHTSMPNRLKKYLLPVFAGFIIASPLPDEIGVTLLAVHRHISVKMFMVLSYLLNTAGIFVILYVGQII